MRRKSQNFQVCGFLTTQFVSVVGVVIIFTLVRVCVKVTLFYKDDKLKGISREGDIVVEVAMDDRVTRKW